MNIEVDSNPTPSEQFFISISISDTEVISFDCTSKGPRVIRQALVERKNFPKSRPPTSEWDVLILESGQFVRKYHAKWIDLGKRDWVNDEIWETTQEKPISKELNEKLLFYSRLISDNYKALGLFSREMSDFEEVLTKEISGKQGF
ncbi:MAG: hypothetical protein JW727_06770 [Candidatus Aenigmarchaeota archaeon]|nr:hypothetical protein [Candidatus Aenigmarchaeota archaeon]